MKLGRCAAVVVFAMVIPLVGVGLAAQPAYALGITTMTVSSSPNPTACAPVTLTAVVQGELIGPIGGVQFLDGATLLGGPILITPDGGFAGLPTSHSTATKSVTLSPGSHTIFALFVGPPDTPSHGSASLNVGAATSTTSVTSSVNPSVFGQQVIFQAAVTSACSGGVAGTVQFTADGGNLGLPQAVDSSGHASIPTGTLGVGLHQVTAEFTSTNSDVQGSTGILPGLLLVSGQVVKAATTTTGVTSSANPSEFGAPVTFTSTTTVSPPGAGTPTGSVQFQDGVTNLDVAQPLGASGQTTVSTANLSVGPHTITASYTSDSTNFLGSSGVLNQTVQKARTTLTYNGATTADFNDPAVLSAQLTRTDNGAPIGGKTVTLAMAAETCSAVTDAAGTAACSIVPSEAAGTYPVTASFAGDGNYLPSGGGAPFLVTREQTSTLYTGPTVIAQGNPVTLSGWLLEDGATPISGRTLTLTLGTGATSQACTTPPTDAAGNAQCTLTNVTVGQGPQPVRADFTGDGYYLPSFDASHQVIVFAFPTSGVFTLGDTTIAANPTFVTYWGAQWATQNVVSGGSVSPSFKGFASNASTNPPSCGGTWTSSPGNSSTPVASVPAYMGTVVTSSITKKGSLISGTITKIVVVITAPGYGPDPGHAGTGTIIATYCG